MGGYFQYGRSRISVWIRLCFLGIFLFGGTSASYGQCQYGSFFCTQCQTCANRGYVVGCGQPCTCVNSCTNGGVRDSQCKCICSVECQNGGTQNSDCSCTCQLPWFGPACADCSYVPYCNNGGLSVCGACNCDGVCQNDGRPNDRCRCSCPRGYGGDTCATCVLQQADCSNNGTLNPSACNCNCPLTCQNSGSQDRFCACSCPYPYQGELCENCSLLASSCKNNGSFVSSQCACDCINATNCTNAGVRSSDRTCGCDCAGNWIGDDCSTCSLNASSCPQERVLDSQSCQCLCPESCANQASQQSDCTCSCNSPWIGNLCETCPRNASFCQNNSTFINETCTCECKNASCPTGSTEDSETCACISSEEGLSGGKIAGIVIGSVFGSALILSAGTALILSLRFYYSQNPIGPVQFLKQNILGPVFHADPST